MHCSPLHTTRRFLSTALCPLVVAGLLLRPAQLDAILIHSHGDAGGHMHLLDRAELNVYHQEHDRLHELEHAEADAHDHADHVAFEHADAPHSEDCGAILVIFGEVNTAKPAPRDHLDSQQHDRNLDATASALADNYTSVAAAEHVSHPWKSANQHFRTPLDALLQSSHAILI